MADDRCHIDHRNCFKVVVREIALGELSRSKIRIRDSNNAFIHKLAVRISVFDVLDRVLGRKVACGQANCVFSHI